MAVAVFEMNSAKASQGRRSRLPCAFLVRCPYATFQGGSVQQMSAFSPPINLETTVTSGGSPQMMRWSPELNHVSSLDFGRAHVGNDIKRRHVDLVFLQYPEPTLGVVDIETGADECVR